MTVAGTAAILTPKQGPELRINGQNVFGVRQAYPIVFYDTASMSGQCPSPVANCQKG